VPATTKGPSRPRPRNQSRIVREEARRPGSDLGGGRNRAPGAQPQAEYPRRGYGGQASVGHVQGFAKATWSRTSSTTSSPSTLVHRGQEEGDPRTIKAAAKKAARVLLAPDPDREAEGHRLAYREEIRPAIRTSSACCSTRSRRRAVNEAILHPSRSRPAQVSSPQQVAARARPAGSATKSVLSCGPRCGAGCRRAGCNPLAVRLVVDREAEIKAFSSRGILDHRDAGGRQRPRLPCRACGASGRPRRPRLSHEGPSQRSRVGAVGRQPCGSASDRAQRSVAKNPAPPFTPVRAAARPWKRFSSAAFTNVLLLGGASSGRGRNSCDALCARPKRPRKGCLRQQRHDFAGVGLRCDSAAFFAVQTHHTRGKGRRGACLPLRRDGPVFLGTKGLDLGLDIPPKPHRQDCTRPADSPAPAPWTTGQD